MIFFDGRNLDEIWHTIFVARIFDIVLRLHGKNDADGNGAIQSIIDDPSSSTLIGPKIEPMSMIDHCFPSRIISPLPSFAVLLAIVCECRTAVVGWDVGMELGTGDG